MKAASTSGSIVTTYLEVVGATMLLQQTYTSSSTIQGAALPNYHRFEGPFRQACGGLKQSDHFKCSAETTQQQPQRAWAAPCMCMEAVKAA